MTSSWTPAEISSICQEAHAPLTQCGPTGYMFLALVTQLFGRSSRYPKQFKHEPRFLFESPVHPLESPIQSIGSPIQSYQFSPQGNPFTELSYSGFKVETRPYDLHGGQAFASTTITRNTDGSPANPFVKRVDLEVEDTEVADTKKVTKKNKSKRKKRHSREEYDFIIVGAGSAGCVLANRLSEVKKWKILLLEAGPEEPDVTMVPAFAPTLAGSSIDWGFRTQPEQLTCRLHRDQSCLWIRGKSMGGSSAVNYMVYMRGNRKDYDDWAAMGNHGWSYKEVLPYFKKAENNRDMESHDKVFHSVGGPLNVERFKYVDINTLMLIESFRERGLPLTDFNGAHQLGTDLAQSTSIDGKRMSTNIAYIRPIEHKRPNLVIIRNAFATKILIDPYTKTAYGVEYVKDGLFGQAFAKKEVISSSGTINSPKLLKLSGVGPKEELESLGIPVLSNLKVGFNLMDHVTTWGLTIQFSNKTSTMVSPDELLDHVYNYYQEGTKKYGPLSSTSTLSGVAFSKSSLITENPGVPDIQYHFDGVNVRELYSDPASYISTAIFPLSFYDGLVARPLLLVPKSRGHILLNVTDPVFGPPLIYSGFFTVKFDLDVMVEAIKFVVSLENTDAFRLSGATFVKTPLKGCEQYIWGTYDYFSCILIGYTSTIYHPAGTCKMGPSWDAGAVVDPRLRVYGIKKLRVVDASIMPVVVRANLNAPTIMIAEKVADYIKEEYLL